MFRLISLFLIIIYGSILAQHLGFNTNNPTVITTDLPLTKKIKAIDPNGDGNIYIVTDSSDSRTVVENVAWFSNVI